MASKKRGLGRGLDALLGVVNEGVQAEKTPAKAARPISGLVAVPDIAPPEVDVSGAGLRVLQLPIERLHPGRYQPRLAMRPEGLEDLAESIRTQGVLQPIVVRPQGEDYEIIAGERRWRATQMAGVDTIPAVVKEVSDSTALAISLIENIQREDLNPIEEAVALNQLIAEFGMTHQEVAETLGRSRAGVSNLLRLLGLEKEVKALVENGDLEMGHARALLGLEGEAQAQAARTVAARGMSVRETEELVRRSLSPPKHSSLTTVKDPNVRALQEDLAGRLGAHVVVQHNTKGKGKLVVHFNNLDELEGILAHID